MKNPVKRKSAPRTTMLKVHDSIAFLNASTTLRVEWFGGAGGGRGGVVLFPRK